MKKFDDVAIGIVLYNPDILLLEQTINNIKEITSDIYFIDNNSKNKKEVQKLLKEYLVIFNDNNYGIAKALNQLLDIAFANGKKYLLTLDQDSRMNFNCFKEMYKFNNLQNVAIICPIIKDLNKLTTKTIKNEYQFVNRCITSGSLMNLKICKNIKKFDEKMFIDYVDFDYCKNVICSGYKIVKVRDAVLEHEVGKRIKRKFLFWTVYPTNHTPQRVYYFSRNIRYYLYKYKNCLTFKEYIHDLIHLIWKFINIVMYEKNKKEKLKMYKKGIIDYRLEEKNDNSCNGTI